MKKICFSFIQILAYWQDTFFFIYNSFWNFSEILYTICGCCIYSFEYIMSTLHLHIALLHFSSFQHKSGFHIPQKYLTRVIGHISFFLLIESVDTQVFPFERTVVIFFFSLSLLNKKQILWEILMAHFLFVFSKWKMFINDTAS